MNRGWDLSIDQETNSVHFWHASCHYSVAFNFLGRDFFNALSQRDPEAFTTQLIKYLGGFAVGIPIFVFSGYFQVWEELN